MSNPKESALDLKIFEIDPWLKPFSSDIALRLRSYIDTKNTLLKEADSLDSFANAHLFFGFHKTIQGWIYREWAPNADEVFLTGEFNNWNMYSHPLSRKENGIWEIILQGEGSLTHLSLVKVIILSNGEALSRIPLYIKRTVQDKNTHEFCGQIWYPDQDYIWTDADFRINRNQSPLIYEAHIGMAQQKEDIGSFNEFTQNILPKIKELGYNTIQLMAVMQHPYYASFGYHVSNFYAVSSWFGTPDELKHLIDSAHSMGIAVLMDIVHSHAVKNTLEGINEFDGSSYQFFHEGPRGYHTAWDSKLFDYSKPEVLHFLLSNIKYWLEEYHFDGFRFDGVTSMIYHNHGLGIDFDHYSKYFSINTDIEAITYLQLANDLIKSMNPDYITIAEDMSGMPGMALPIAYGGIGFDYRLAMGLPDFWIKILDIPDEKWDMYSLWHEITSKRPGESRIAYAESHDQALVGDKTLIFRLADKNMYWHMSKDDTNHEIDRAISLHKLFRFITLSAAGEGYLNFMGNEFGHPEWIDFPREGNNWSFKYCQRKWYLMEDEQLKYRYLYNFDKKMIEFAKNEILADVNEINELFIDNDRKILVFKKDVLIFIFNFNSHISFSNFSFPTNDIHTYRAVFDSDSAEFGGHSRVSHDVTYKSSPLGEFENKTGITIYSPNRTCIVLKQI